jgi:DDE superfamily endonuclease
MTLALWTEWLRSFDTLIGLRKRKALLLIDNAPSHGKEPPRLEHVAVEYLAPSMTAHIQPLDGGIISTFKAHYRKLFLAHLIDQYDANMPFQKLDIKSAIYFLADAWHNVTPATIKNCRDRVGILVAAPPLKEPLPIAHDLHMGVESLIHELNIDPEVCIMTDEYPEIDMTATTYELFSDETIVDEVNRHFELPQRTKTTRYVVLAARRFFR